MSRTRFAGRAATTAVASATLALSGCGTGAPDPASAVLQLEHRRGESTRGVGCIEEAPTVDVCVVKLASGKTERIEVVTTSERQTFTTVGGGPVQSALAPKRFQRLQLPRVGGGRSYEEKSKHLPDVVTTE